MMVKFKQSHKLDHSDWVILILSWMIYFGGLIFFSKPDTSWVLIALGALPVLVTGWILGMSFGAGAAFLSITIHLLLTILRPAYSGNINHLQFLVGFSLLVISGMLIGHLRDLQIKTRSQLDVLSENNQLLSQLSRLLETVNNLTTELISTQDWMDKLSNLILSIGMAADIDHIFLFQLQGNGSVNYSGRTHHYWSDAGTDNPRVSDQHQFNLCSQIQDWISTAENGIPFCGSLSSLLPDTRSQLASFENGNYAVFPIFTKKALWGFIGFEDTQSDTIWDQLELNTYKSIAQTLGSTFYKKLIEENLILRAKELDSLQKTSSNISSSNHLETGLQTVLSQILELTPAYDTNIYLYNNKALDFYISLGKNKQQSLPFSHVGEEEVARTVAETHQDLYISNLAKHNPALAEQQEALISFSLKAASEVIGVLNIWFASVRDFPEEEKIILRLLADQAAAAILNIQFLQVEREQRILADSLRKANLQLSDNLELKQVLESILEQVLRLVSARDGHILLYDGKVLEFGAVKYAEDVQHDPVHLPDMNSLFYETVRRGERILVPDIQGENQLQDTWKTGSLISLPLIFHRRVIGVMNVSFFEPGEVDDQFLQVLDLLSNQAAIAINNARTFEAEREQRKLAQALQHTGRVIQSSLDLEVVLDQILTQIGSVIPYHSANLMLVDEGVARVVRQQGYQEIMVDDPEEIFHTPFIISRFSTLQKMTESKKPLIIPDTQANPDWVKTLSTARVLSWAGAPILDGDEVIGFLSLNNHSRRFYQDEHADTLSAFAGQASIALKNSRLFQQLQQHARELGALHEATSTLVTTLKLDELLSKILEGAVQAIPSTELGALFLADEETKVLQLKAAFGDDSLFDEEYPLDLQEFLPVSAYLQNEPLTLDSQKGFLLSETQRMGRTQAPLQSAIAAPLPTQDGVLGVIFLAGAEVEQFTENDLKILTNIAVTTASAIHNAQLHKEIQALAITDPLTSIFNRRGLDQWGHYEFDRAKRFNSPLSVIFFDLDQFKQVNDTYGHEVGDFVLKKVVSCCQEVIRKIDIFSRIGGEEFVIILPETPLRTAVQVAERIRKSVAKFPAQVNSHTIKMTISAGVSELNEDIDDLMDLIHDADQYMFQAKQAGRNTTVSAISKKIPKKTKT